VDQPLPKSIGKKNRQNKEFSSSLKKRSFMLMDFFRHFFIIKKVYVDIFFPSFFSLFLLFKHF